MTETVKIISVKIDISGEDHQEISLKDKRKIEEQFQGKVVKVSHPAEENLCDHLSDTSGWLITIARFMKINPPEDQAGNSRPLRRTLLEEEGS